MANFPLNGDRCRQWVKAVGKEDLVYVPIEKLHSLKYVCGDHFEKKAFNKKKSRLKKFAIPTLNLKAVLPDEILLELPCHIHPTNRVSQTISDAKASQSKIEAIAGPSTSELRIPGQQLSAQSPSDQLHHELLQSQTESIDGLSTSELYMTGQIMAQGSSVLHSQKRKRRFSSGPSTTRQIHLHDHNYCLKEKVNQSPKRRKLTGPGEVGVDARSRAHFQRAVAIMLPLLVATYRAVCHVWLLVTYVGYATWLRIRQIPAILDLTEAAQESGDCDSSLDDDDDDDCDAEDSELRMEHGHGVCVVRARGRDEAGQQFELDEAALSALLRRRGLRARPVVLLSVAGAFRGGKSFLLDFLLRYLYAEESARGDGSWLGAPDEPLRGFSWRGGCARDTQGLVLWSQPFPVTLPDGQKVVVLLMDTQGSFDDQSSYRDCSLIFALSTLLSSVQVYNLSQRINESDLQHLQVFTEHAAAGGGAMPALQLLVRDWSAPADFGYGAAGGADYLRHKLQVREEQPRELREVRQRLASSFERVACYLLPHPGLAAAADAAFRGQLADLTEDFKDSLRVLVPLLLAPELLRVKKVDGRVLRARDLAVHLRAYLDTFRHHVPSPQSIMRAQAAACWLTAAAGARRRLHAQAPGPDAPARGRAALRARLSAERRAALEQLAELAAHAGDEAGLEDLEKELDEQVDQNIYINEEKIASAVSAATEEWERAARALRDPALCAPARDLREDEAAARAAALALYDRRVADPEEPDRAQLIEELEGRGAELVTAACATSARNHTAAASAALAALRDSLPRGCLHPADLAAAHNAAAERARARLRAARTRPARHDPDPYFTDLDEKIAVYLREHEAQNVRNNSAAVDEAYGVFCARMDALGVLQLSAAELADGLADAEGAAKRAFFTKRTCSRPFGIDIYYNRLMQRMRDRHDYYREQNGRRLTAGELAAGLGVAGAALAVGAAAAAVPGAVGVVLAGIARIFS